MIREETSLTFNGDLSISVAIHLGNHSTNLKGKREIDDEESERLANFIVSEISSQSSKDLLQFIDFDVTIAIVIEASEGFQDLCARELFEIEISDNIGELFEFDSTVLYKPKRSHPSPINKMTYYRYQLRETFVVLLDRKYSHREQPRLVSIRTWRYRHYYQYRTAQMLVEVLGNEKNRWTSSVCLPSVPFNWLLVSLVDFFVWKRQTDEWNRWSELLQSTTYEWHDRCVLREMI